MLGFMRLWVLFGGSFGEVLCGSVGLGRRIFLGGFGGAEGNWSCLMAGVWVLLCGLFRVKSVDVGVGVSRLLMVYEVVCFVGALLGLRMILSGLRVGLVVYWIREVTYESSFPVKTYRRCDRESVPACCWVWQRVGMRPWYMVSRLIRSMCRPHVHPSVC